MKNQLKNILFITIFSFLVTTDTAMANDDYEKLNPLIDKIEAGIPKNWRVVEKKPGVIPEYHYEGMQYDGPKGVYLIVAGDQDYYFRWKDRNGEWHQEPSGKEAIELWVMPAQYHESWRRFFVFKGHVRAPEVYSNQNARVYGYDSAYSDPERASERKRRYKEIWPYITETGGMPEHTVRSWVNWREDIKKILQDFRSDGSSQNNKKENVPK
jgi:hypothetical protein